MRFEYVNPEFFWLFLLLPLVAGWYYWKRNRLTPSVRLSAVRGLHTGANWLAKMRPALMALRLLALAMLIVAMARPRNVDEHSRIKKTEGIDIVMAVDISASMLARDLKPNRLEALKQVAANFVTDRPNDRIGIVIYAGESYTQTPLTSDQNVVIKAIHDIKYNTVIEGGTAIGVGLATAVNRLKDSPAKSKIIILLTDGVNNMGFIDPQLATEMAVAHDIKVYSIGIGSTGTAMMPVALNPDGSFRYARGAVEIDEELMKTIAQATGGSYFRAHSNTRLEDIYEEINEMEKTEIEELHFTSYDEKFRPFLIWGGVFLLVEWVLRFTLFRSFV